MKKSTRRYIYLDFDDLRNIKFRKLEKVCDRLFVFVRKEEQNIPVDLVQKMQRFGRNAKWVVIDGLDPEQNMNYHVSFFMGKLHERVDAGIEFAILSNDESYDTLVNYINNQSVRSCIRVKGKARKPRTIRRQVSTRTEHSNFTLADEMKSEEVLKAYAAPVSAIPVKPAVVVASGYDEMIENKEPLVKSVNKEFKLLQENSFNDEGIVERTANETVQRLVRSGNRPALVSTLKNYILLHNQELSIHSNIDKIIDYMQTDKKIEVNDGEVVYHF